MVDLRYYSIMYRVQYKSKNAHDPWFTFSSHVSERLAISRGDKISSRFFMVRVVDKNGSVVMLF